MTLPSVDGAVRRLDEAEVVHASERRERRDQADVRSFRRLDRTDSPVVGRMNVAHLEARALARQATRPECRKAPLVRHRRERVRLIHELRELTRAEELLDDRRNRLGVDQIVRHQRLDLLERHALLDRALHAHQTDPVLVLEQLADDAHPAVAEVVDVVDALVRIGTVLQIDEILDRGEDVVAAKRREIDPAESLPPALDHARMGLPDDSLFRVHNFELVVHLQPTDAREVVALWIEEEVVEKVRRRVERRRITGRRRR